MGLINDTVTLYEREMLIFKANLRTNIIRSVLFPLVIIIFFGNVAISFRNLPVAVVNYANNQQSYSFISDLQSNQYFQIATITNEQEALSILKLGNVQMVVVILPDFPSSNKSITSIQLYYSNAEFGVIKDAVQLIKSYANNYGPGTVSQPNTAATSNQTINNVVVSNALFSARGGTYTDFLTAGIIGIVVLFGAFYGSGTSFISDRQLGHLKAFLITPIKKNSIILGRILSGTTQCIAFGFLTLLLGLFLGVTIEMGPLGLLYLLLVTFLLGLGFSGLALILASVVSKVDTFSIFTQSIGLPLWFISGGIIPLLYMPSWIIPLTLLDPLTYSNDLIRAVLVQGIVTSGQFITDISALIIFAVVMVIFAFRTFKPRIE